MNQIRRNDADIQRQAIEHVRNEFRAALAPLLLAGIQDDDYSTQGKFIYIPHGLCHGLFVISTI